MCTSNGAEERDSAEPAEPNRASLAVTRAVGGQLRRTNDSLSLSLSFYSYRPHSQPRLCSVGMRPIPYRPAAPEWKRANDASERVVASGTLSCSRVSRHSAPPPDRVVDDAKLVCCRYTTKALVTVWSQHFDFGLERDVLAFQPPPLPAPRRRSPSSVARGPRSSFAPHTAKLRTQNLNAGRDRHRECTAPWAVRHAE